MVKPVAEPGRFRIKQASAEDLLPAARAMATAWRQSFPFDEAVFDAQDAGVEERARGWDQRNRTGEYFWVVVDTANASEVVGVASARIAEDDDAPTPLYLALCYLTDVAKGSGIADRLLEMSIGDAPAYLWVLEGNERAIAFYERHGFVLDGARRALTDGMEPHHDVRMVRG